MDISNIDYNFIELFALSYAITKDVFKVDPIEASAKKQKKIRRWIEKDDIAGETFPKGVMRYISKDVSDAKFIEFMKACYDHVQKNGTHKRQLFDKFSIDLKEDVKCVLWELLEEDVCCARFVKKGADAQIDIHFGAGHDCTLILLNASGIPEGRFDYLSFENSSFIKVDDEYRLIGEAENMEDDTMFPFAVRFTDARVEIKLSRADEGGFYHTPWAHLQSIASVILDKYFLPGDYFNDREKELLPLIVEISKLSFWSRIPEEFKDSGFSCLKSHILQYGYHELLPLLEKLEKEKTNSKKKDRLIDKLTSKLNQQKYEPLWREIYQQLAESQKEYPSRVDLVCPADLLNETRNKIQRQMEAHGYEGTYPDFVKSGSIRGVRLADSYDISYLVGMEKKAAYHIHCDEEYTGDCLKIWFICGTELLGKEESIGDIYSCMFNAKGRRFFQNISCDSDHINADGEIEHVDLEQRIQIAVKKAELKKLTKEERKVLCGFEVPWFKIFFIIFVVMGGFFAIFMTLGMMLFAVLSALIVGQPQSIPLMFTDIPWWFLFIIAWVGFGGAMGIITVLAKRK